MLASWPTRSSLPCAVGCRVQQRHRRMLSPSPSPHIVTNNYHSTLTLPACPHSGLRVYVPVEVRVWESALDDARSTSRDEPAFEAKKVETREMCVRLIMFLALCKETKTAGSIVATLRKTMLGQFRPTSRARRSALLAVIFSFRSSRLICVTKHPNINPGRRSRKEILGEYNTVASSQRRDF